MDDLWRNRLFDVEWFGSFPNPPPFPVSKLDTKRLIKRDNVLTGDGGGSREWGRARSQIIRQRKSLVLYKSSNFVLSDNNPMGRGKNITANSETEARMLARLFRRVQNKLFWTRLKSLASILNNCQPFGQRSQHRITACSKCTVENRSPLGTGRNS